MELDQIIKVVDVFIGLLVPLAVILASKKLENKNKIKEVQLDVLIGVWKYVNTIRYINFFDDSIGVDYWDEYLQNFRLVSVGEHRIFYSKKLRNKLFMLEAYKRGQLLIKKTNRMKEEDDRYQEYDNKINRLVDEIYSIIRKELDM